jgi:hypothetical protein
MIRRRPDACVLYRPALVDFVERQALGPDSPLALEHLARCASCERDLTEVAQTVIALRRMGERAAAVEVPSDGWATLRVRIERSQRAADDAARRLRRAFGGAVVAVALVVLVAVPSLNATLTPGLHDGLAAVPATRQVTPDVRRYDPFAQPLTEGIVLAIAGSGPPRPTLAEAVSAGPISTDRHDHPRVFVRVRTTEAPSAPRTALRT